MSVRTYNPSVRVGNWNEDVALEEVWNVPLGLIRIWCALIRRLVHNFVGHYKGFPTKERQWRIDGSEDTQPVADHIKAFTTS